MTQGYSVAQIIVALVLAIVGINLTGVDPADIVSAGFVAVLVLIRPDVITASRLSFGAKVGALIFLSFYVTSCVTGGITPSFVANFASGVFLSITLYYYCLVDDGNKPIGIFLAYGFGVVTAVYGLIGLVGLGLGDLFFDIFRDGRFLGIPGDPNFNGLLASFVIFIMMDRLLKEKITPRQTAISVAVLLIAIATILSTGSRAAWASFAVGMVVYLLSSRDIFSPRLVVTFGILLAGILGLSVSDLASESGGQIGSVSDRLRTLMVQDDSAEQERFEFVYTAASLQVAREYPLGVGPGMTAIHTGLVNADNNPVGSHNAYVQIYAENGIFCLLVVLALLGVTWLRLFRMAAMDLYLNQLSCRVILAGVTVTAIFGMGHDLISWRIAWLFPILGILAAFDKRAPAMTERLASA